MSSRNSPVYDASRKTSAWSKAPRRLLNNLQLRTVLREAVYIDSHERLLWRSPLSQGATVKPDARQSRGTFESPITNSQKSRASAAIYYISIHAGRLRLVQLAVGE